MVQNNISKSDKVRIQDTDFNALNTKQRKIIVSLPVSLLTYLNELAWPWKFVKFYRSNRALQAMWRTFISKFWLLKSVVLVLNWCVELRCSHPLLLERLEVLSSIATPIWFQGSVTQKILNWSYWHNNQWDSYF